MCARLDTTGLLADVVYDLLRVQQPAGRGRFRLYRRADNGFWMTDELNLDVTELPPPIQYVEVHAGADWRVESLDLRLAHLGWDASYRAEGLTWRAKIQIEDETVERAAPFGPTTQVSCSSIWMDAIALNRLRLATGQARDVNVISISPHWRLEPKVVRQRYECMGPERIATPVGDLDAVHHVIASARHVWVDSHGIIVAARLEEALLQSDIELVEYHWLGAS